MTTVPPPGSVLPKVPQRARRCGRRTLREAGGALGAGGISRGRIIAISHDRKHQNVAEVSGNPLISGKFTLVKYYILARYLAGSE